MQNQIFERGRFKTAFPKSWSSSDENGVISFYNSVDGVGALQFSIFNVPNSSSLILESELSDLIDERYDQQTVINSDFVKAYYLDKETKKHWKYCLFRKPGLLIFASYNCPEKDIKIEEKFVEEIVFSAYSLVK